MPDAAFQTDNDGGSTASESDNVQGAVFAGRRYAKPRAEVVWEQLGEFSRVSMTEAEIKKAVLEIAQNQIVPFLGPERKEIKVLQTDLSRWKQKQSYVSHDGTMVHAYFCPGRHRLGCQAGLRVKYLDNFVIVEICNPHNPESHAVDKSFRLSMVQKDKIIQLIQEQPSLSARNIMQTMERRGEPIQENNFRSVKRLLQQQRPRVEAEATGGVHLNGTVGSFTQLAESIWSPTALER